MFHSLRSVVSLKTQWLSFLNVFRRMFYEVHHNSDIFYLHFRTGYCVYSGTFMSFITAESEVYVHCIFIFGFIAETFKNVS